jgi:hypothetical protein
LVSESEEVEEVVSVVEDKGEEAGGVACWAKAEPHSAKRTTSLIERRINRFVGLVFMGQSTIKSGLYWREAASRRFQREASIR